MRVNDRKHFIGWSIGEIHRAFADNTLSPLAVANLCAARMRETEPSCQAWEVFDEALLERQALDTQDRLANHQQMRLLEGIPVGIKDILNTIDFPTQMGSPIWKGFTPGNDARSVFNLKRQGAILPGKTVTAEFAVHTLGKTLNPHDASRNPGTSSSGSAAAVAAGVVPVAVGTQTAGSITRPASYCGIYGCKPSFGLIPRTGMLKTTDSLDTVGFFVGCAVDLRRVLDSLRVSGRDYPIAEAAFADPVRTCAPSGRPWRIALVQTHTWQFAKPYAREAITSWAERLNDCEGFALCEVDLPDSMRNAHEIHSLIYDRSLSYYFKEEYKKAELVSPVMNALIERGMTIPNDRYQRALREQEQLARDMDAFFGEYDVLVSLSTAGEAPARDDAEAPDPSLMWTLTQLPTVSAPAFLSPSLRPFGLQLVARRYNDLQLFSLIDELCRIELLPPHQYPPLDGEIAVESRAHRA